MRYVACMCERELYDTLRVCVSVSYTVRCVYV